MSTQLSGKQAAACESAKGGRCRCRCNGQFHGAARVTNVLELPKKDPHALEGAARRTEIRRQGRAERMEKRRAAR